MEKFSKNLEENDKKNYSKTGSGRENGSGRQDGASGCERRGPRSRRPLEKSNERPQGEERLILHAGAPTRHQLK